MPNHLLGAALFGWERPGLSFIAKTHHQDMFIPAPVPPVSGDERALDGCCLGHGI